MGDLWRINLFGGLRAQQGERVITRFRTQKVASLFACLAFHLRQAHSREVLIEMLWPESDALTLRNSLSVALSSLRNQLEPPGVPQGTVIRADRFSVGLNPATVTTDVMEFELAIKAAAKAGSAIERAQYLTTAVELYQGQLLPGLYEDWITAEQDRLSGLFFDSVEALVGHFESLGDTRTALMHARHAVSVDPLREEGQHLLIRLLHAARQQVSALRQYREYERILDEEVGERPSPVLQSLAQRIESESGPPTQAPDPAPPRKRMRKAVVSPASSVGHDTVTFLLSDIVGITQLFHNAPKAYTAARLRYQKLIRQQILSYGGWEVQASGHGSVIAFASAGSALKCAVATQRALAEEAWPEEVGSLKVRMAAHTGDMMQSGEEYHGAALHQASRILTSAHGGQVLASDTTASLVSSLGYDDIRLVNLGVWRLRDVPEPRRLFQVEYAGMAQTVFKAPLAESGHKSNIPARFTRFFGRQAEMEHLRELLATPEVRLVTVTGPAGNGKTRISLEVADQLSETFEGAVYWVVLSDMNDPALISGAILDSLGVIPSPQKDLMDQAVDALSVKPSLVVVDNFEHLVEGGAELVQRLLTRVGTLKLLVTSRRLLGLSGEYEFALPPMPVPGKEDNAERLSVYDSVQLFIDRAHQAMPHFQVSNANAAAVASLVAGLEGIPLAIELAAARVQVFTPSQMLAQLSNRFDFLSSRKRDVAERQRTLRGAVEWSYRLLTPELQRFFARLSVFRGGWSIEAAEAICEETLALDYLEQLRECSLILAGDVEGETFRFRMLETLRDYGLEQLKERGEDEILHRRHCEYFVELAESAEPYLDAFSGISRVSHLERESAKWRERIELDYGNLRAALDRSMHTASSMAVRLVGALYAYWMVYGHWHEGRRWLNQVLELVDRSADACWAKAIYAAGVLSWAQDDYRRARSLFEESLALFQALDDKSGVADSLSCLANVALRQGDYARSIQAQEEAISVQSQLGGAGAKSLLTNLGKAVFELGDETRGLALLREGVAANRAEVVPATWLANSLVHLERARYYAGDSAGSITTIDECLSLFREAGNPLGVSSALDVRGLVAVRENDLAGARLMFRESLEIRHKLGDQRGIADSLAGFASLAVKEGASARVAQLLGSAQRIREAIGEFTPDCQTREMSKWLDAAREAVGIAAIDTALSNGRALSLEEAISYALDE